MRPSINYTGPIENLLPTPEALPEQTLAGLLEVCESFVQVPDHRALIISRNAESHIIIVKQNSYIKISIIDSLVTDETIALIKNTRGISNFEIDAKEQKRRIRMMMQYKMDVLSTLLSVVSLICASTDRFLINIYKHQVQKSRT